VFDAPAFTSDVDPTIVLAVFGTLAAAGAAYAIAMAIRLRDAVPVVVCVGALVCAFNEPIYDILGKIAYAEDHPMAYTLMGREIPWFLVVGYLPWVGVAPWILSRRMETGVSRRALHLFAAATFLSVALVELLGTSLDAWVYYAPIPIEWLVVAPQMAVCPLLGAFLLHALAPWAQGWRRLLMVVPPMVALPATYAASSWPMYAAAYGDVSAGIRWLGAAVSMGLLVGMVAAIAAASEALQRVRKARPQPQGPTSY
jgi:hypothetical protein